LAIKHYKIACKEGNCMDSYKALGLLYKREGMNRQAIVEFEHFIALNPYDYDVVNSLGLAYDEEGNRDKAE
jgi:Flp pilus assembly protein TadD